MIVLKKPIIASLLFLTFFTTHAQTLFTYGSKSVSREEFLKAFNKNNSDIKPGLQAYREYLDLYTRFKIKVQAAFDMKLDTLPSQQSELKSFRSQVAASYMNDEASMNVLIEEAIKRSSKDIRVSHIFVQLPTDANIELQQKALAKINEAFNHLQKGESFEKVATTFSDDPTVVSNHGDIGFITALVLPYNLENLAYNTLPGKYSKPYQTKIGYHIFKNTGERKAAGRLRAAQILISFPPDATPVQKQQSALRADSIYRALLNGSDFKQLALHFSNDNLSYQNGGEMPEFGTGRYEPAFESAAFALQKDGDISKPIETSFGYHIIKRIQLKPVLADKNNKSVVENYRQLIAQNDRMEVSKKILLKKIMQQTGFKKFPVNKKSLDRITDSALQNKSLPVLTDVKGKTALFSFQKQTVTVQDWVSYLEAIRSVENLHTGKTKEQLFEQYVETTAMEYYREHLESYNKAFAYQLKEFKEGNLLFEIMQRKIWDKASTDSVGLIKYYESHKTNYWWDASADALILTSSNDSVTKATKAKLSVDFANWRQLVDKSAGTLLGDSGRFEFGQLPVAERTIFSPGLVTATVKNETDNSETFCYIIKLYNNRELRNFNDARGFVINDYQNFLEEKWMVELKKKYPIVVNEGVLKSLPK